ncbi:MAG: Rieske (2Fe-2S) protein [Synechococcaceae cyanobacterium SM2_3_1]|nr:Rieske (2Fe-2S) protein [Synechococcaceae cyanobacterium SM2_3_1]
MIYGGLRIFALPEPDHAMTTPPLAQTLPGFVYSDPAIFAREQQQIFSNMWIYVARSEDLPGVGHFKCIHVGGESVIVVRGQDQQLRAFYNVCRHRGSRLCTEESGSLSVLRCRYHAWGYDLDGSLISAPSATALTEFDSSQFGLIPVNLEIWQGMVWINLSDSPTSLVDHVLPLFWNAWERGKSLLLIPGTH